MENLPVYASVEHLWSPESEWYTLDVDACSWGLERGMGWEAEGEPRPSSERLLDPEETLCNQCLEEAASDGKPEVTLPELTLADTVWQAKAKEKKKKKAATTKKKDDDEDEDDEDEDDGNTLAALEHLKLTADSVPAPPAKKAKKAPPRKSADGKRTIYRRVATDGCMCFQMLIRCRSVAKAQWQRPRWERQDESALSGRSVDDDDDDDDDDMAGLIKTVHTSAVSSMRSLLTMT
ncbi:hypothetical protein Q7P37_003308 [Cladosporium fusiforme]